MAVKLPTVSFACPTYGPIHRRVYESHLSAIGNLAKSGVVCEPHSVLVTGKMGLASASNAIVEAALQINTDYVFWTEMDMILPPHTIATLLKHAQQYDLPVLSGVYFLRGNAQPCLYRKSPHKGASRYAHTIMTVFPKDSLFPVDVPGVGCVLFKTEVFKKISKPWWDDQEGTCGQDMYFYTKCREAGIKVYADSTVICGQIDDDEPKMWDEAEYLKWRETHAGTGYVLTADHPSVIHVEK